jgi:hypothetical protein
VASGDDSGALVVIIDDDVKGEKEERRTATKARNIKEQEKPWPWSY